MINEFTNRGSLGRPEPLQQRPVDWEMYPVAGSMVAEMDDAASAAAINALAMEIAAEVQRAERKHAPMHSPHEGWSVIFEELEELREHVRGDTGRSADARKEAIQVAAMGLRYALNLCSPAAE